MSEALSCLKPFGKMGAHEHTGTKVSLPPGGCLLGWPALSLVDGVSLCSRLQDEEMLKIVRMFLEASMR